MELNSVACYRLENMLYLYIKKGKEEMETSPFKKYIGGTVACMKKLTRVKKGCVQLLSSDTYFYDIWFRGVKIYEEVINKGVDY